MLKAGKKKPNPRKQFMEDMDKEIRKYQDDGHEILFMADMNDTPDDSEIFRTFLDSRDLLDLHTPREGETTCWSTRTPYHPRRVVYMYGTRNIYNAVIRRGMIPDSINDNGDHLSMYIDLDEKYMYGQPAEALMTPATRRLHTESPIRLEKYIKELRRMAEGHKLLDRARKLKARFLRTNRYTDRDHQTYETLDQEFQDYRIGAEKRCSRAQYGHPFSPDLMKAGQHVITMKQSVREIGKRKNSTTKQQALQEATNELKKAEKDLKAIEKRSPQLRNLFLEETIEIAEAQGNHDKAKELRQMKKKEELQTTYNKVKRFLKPKEWTETDRVLIPDPEKPGEWKEETEAKKIFSILLEQGSKEFNKAKRSPFTQKPLRDDIPLWEYSDRIDEILNGEYTPPP
jgi:hypothetical protein